MHSLGLAKGQAVPLHGVAIMVRVHADGAVSFLTSSLLPELSGATPSAMRWASWHASAHASPCCMPVTCALTLAQCEGERLATVTAGVKL